jgi:hypothetical protein
LFKINADLDSEVERSPDNTRHYARLIATLARRLGPRHFTAGAVARSSSTPPVWRRMRSD